MTTDHQEPVHVPVEQEERNIIMRIILLMFARPEGVAIIAFVVLMGLITGLLPSAITDDVSQLKESQQTIIQQHETLSRRIDEAIAAGQKQDEQIAKLLRGICLLQARGSDQLSLQYCNP